MQNELVVTPSNSKAYTMLFITDYKNASVKEKTFITTVRNNLLDLPNDNSNQWVKYINLPQILVSLIDIVESRSKAFDMLDTGRYDVIFVSNKVEGKPIGSGYLRNIQKHHPNALIIPFIQATQIRGAIKKDGSVNTGEGILSIFNCGIYTCMLRNRLDLGELIRIIHAGGRTKEEAFEFYGLDRDLTATDRKGQKVISEAETVGVNKPDAPEPASDPQQQHNFQQDEQLSSSYLPEELNEEKKDNADMLTETRINENDKQQFSKPEGDENNGKKIPYMERRKREKRKRKQQTQPDTSSDEKEKMYETDEHDSVNDDTDTGAVNKQDKFATYAPHQEDNKVADELKHVLLERGQINNGLAKAGMLQGRVVFAKGNTAWIELDKHLEDIGLHFTDLYNMPVVVPYTKFGDM